MKSFEDIRGDQYFFTEYENRKKMYLERILEKEQRAQMQLNEFRKLLEEGFNMIIKTLEAKKKEVLSEFDKLQTESLSYLTQEKDGNYNLQYESIPETLGAIHLMKGFMSKYSFQPEDDFHHKVLYTVHMNGKASKSESNINRINHMIKWWYQPVKDRLQGFGSKSTEQIKTITLKKLLTYSEQPFNLLLDDGITGNS